MKNKAFVKALVALVAIFAFGYAALFFQIQREKRTNIGEENKSALLVVGYNKGKNDIFQNELTGAFERQSYVNKAVKLFEEGNLDAAIKEFEVALSVAKMPGEKGSIIVHLADVYEAKRDYKKALEYVVIDRDQYINDWAKEPVIERAKYLEFALEGKYELAVEHAEKAAKAYADIFGDGREPRSDYTNRLNDLKAAKQYILNIKKK